MKIKLPLISLGFIALTAYMIYCNAKGYGWAMFFAAATASDFLAELIRAAKEPPTNSLN